MGQFETYFLGVWGRGGGILVGGDILHCSRGDNRVEVGVFGNRMVWLCNIPTGEAARVFVVVA